MSGAKASALPRYLPGLDVVRAIAAAMVVVCHAVRASTIWNPAWTALHPHAGAGIETSMSLLGAWGVGLFFVLSGVCIHLPRARAIALGEPPSLETSTYFWRRFRRIYPPHFLALTISAGVAFALAGPLLAFGVHPMISVPTAKQLVLHLLLLHSFFPSAVSSVNHVLWSIAVEAHFYLLYPLLLLARRRVGIARLCLALLLFSIAVKVGAHGLSAETKRILAQSFLCRFWEWTLGCAVAEWLCVRGPLPRVTLPRLLGAMGVSFLLGGLASRLPYGSLCYGTLWPVLFGLIVIGACGLVISTEHWLVRTGTRSYSLYLTHPIALTVGLLLARRWGLPFWSECLVALPLITAGMFAFYRVAEAPFLSKKRAVTTAPSRAAP